MFTWLVVSSLLGLAEPEDREAGPVEGSGAGDEIRGDAGQAAGAGPPVAPGPAAARRVRSSMADWWMVAALRGGAGFGPVSSASPVCRMRSWTRVRNMARRRPVLVTW
jgi:hypothetical protein